MAGLSKIWKISIVLCMFVTLAFSAPASVQASPAAFGSTVVYNLFATDAFVRMANGDIVYNYGFVGGRAGVKNVQFQESVGINGDNLENTTLPDGFPTPSAGEVTPAEEELQGNAQFPAPLIYAKVGDVVQINLKNLGTTNPSAPNDPHSIHLHGLDVNAANDGVPETSIGAIPANLEDTPGAGNVVVYMFTPKVPGTYMYHCHQEADIHVNMGMYGALVIYNPTDVGAIKGPTAGAGTEYGYQYDRDYVLLLSEIDPDGHASEQNSTDFNWTDYKPRFWFINGLSFPQTIHAGFPAGYSWTDWIRAHPGYDPLIQGSVANKYNAYWGTKGEKVLIRMINMGFESQPMHMHGYHGKILATDERPLTWANKPKMGYSRPTPFNEGYEKQTLLIGSGETYDWLVDMGQQSLTGTYPVNTQTRYDGLMPVSNTKTDKPVILFNGDPEAGGTYIGGPVVGPGASDANSIPAQLLGTTIVGQLFPFHNHDDYKATNDGQYPGGMFTMIKTLP